MRREKKNERSRSVTQCNAAHAIQAFVLVLSAFSSACVHSLLLEPCNRTNTPTTVNFQLKLDVCGKVTSRLLLSFLLMRITIWKMKRKITEKPQNLNSNAPEFIWKCNNLLKSHQCGQVPYTHTHTHPIVLLNWWYSFYVYSTIHRLFSIHFHSAVIGAHQFMHKFTIL